MTGRAINLLSPEELDAVSGGMIYLPLIAVSVRQPAKEPVASRGVV
jgi:hypothetical protein